MILHRLTESPGPALGRALSEFERGFRYPLGPGRRFRVDHGEDYGRFFRAMGDAACFVAERDGRVVGAASAALRTVLAPTGEERRACYVGDLKVAKGSRRGVTLLRVLEALSDWARGGGADMAYGVAMDGTATVPTSYTGRAGLPRFDAVASVAILRLPAGRTALRGARVSEATLAEARSRFCALSRGRLAVPPGEPTLRSRREPLALVDRDGSACGVLEDTMGAKRLWEDDGTEIVSAHLSAFAFDAPVAGARLVADALERTAASGVGALFVAVAPRDAEPLLALLEARGATVAPATVYAAGLDPGPDWNLASAEV